MTKVMVEPIGWMYVVMVLDWYTKKIVGHYAGLQAKTAQWLAALDSAVQRQCPHGSRDHGLHLMSDNGVSAHRRRVHEGCGDVGHYASIYQLQQSEGERGYGTPNANAEGRTTLAP